jgi:flagellar protein FlaG
MTTELSNTMVMELRRSSSVARQDSVKATQKTGASTSSRPAQDPRVQQEAVREVGSEVLQETVREMNVKVQNLRRNLQFSIDDISGRSVVKVIDAETDEVIRQIPSEEILNLAHRLTELNEEQGVIFHGTV